MSCPHGSPSLLPSSKLLREADGDLHAVNRTDEPSHSPLMIEAVSAALRGFIDHQSYPCVGAKSALNQGSYFVGLYDRLGSRQAAEPCTRDLQWFAHIGAEEVGSDFATLIAVFKGSASSEQGFSEQFWEHLRLCHEIDSEDYEWDPDVSSDPTSGEFSYSIGGRAFFLVGMHPFASRQARRLPFTAIVFNLHQQFEALREQGRFEPIRDSVRKRERALEGTPNPMVCDHGKMSEALQYDGVEREASWRPPFPAPTSPNEEGRQSSCPVS